MKEIIGFPMYTLSDDGVVYSRYQQGYSWRYAETSETIETTPEGGRE